MHDNIFARTAGRLLQASYDWGSEYNSVAAWLIRLAGRQGSELGCSQFLTSIDDRDFGISIPHVRSLSLEAGIEGSRGMLLLSDDS